MKNAIVFLAASCLAACGFASTITVTSTADDYPTGPEGSLRAALAAAQDGDTITFDASLAGQTIAIVGVNTAKADTSLVIDKALTIEGNGVIVDGGWNGVAKSSAGGRIFLVPADVGPVTIRNLTMQNGHGRGWNGGSGWNFSNQYFHGGAICALSPVRFENCSFIHNASADETAHAPEKRGGGAIYAEDDVELVSCNLLTNCIPSGSSSYGGAIYMAKGSLSARRCVFDKNYSDSYCGCIFASAETTSVLLEDCLVEHSSCVGGNGVHGGFMWSKIPLGTGHFIRFTRCAFRDNYLRNSGGAGGVLYAESNAPVTITACEFSDNRATTGGSVRSEGKPTIYANCTFTGGAMNGDCWGPTLDMRGETYAVNCTFGGNAFLNNSNSGGGSATASGASATYLNCALAYNYRNVGQGVGDAVKLNGDVGKFGGGWTLINTVANGKDADGTSDLEYAATLEDVASATPVFADYRLVDSVMLYAQPAPLKDSFVFPAFAEDSLDKTAPRVFVPAEGGILDGTGYPVKVNADYTWIQYSADDGATWTDLYKASGADDSTLALITADQRGVPYPNGKTPIGAATVAGAPSGAGMMLYVF